MGIIKRAGILYEKPRTGSQIMGLFTLCCYNRAMKNRPIAKNTLIALIILSLFSLSVFAESVTNLYKTVVPVSGQGSGERLRAVRVGLGKVLVKVTGNSQVLSKVNGADAFSNAERYVTEYGYISYQNLLADETSSSPGIAMSLSFDESSINRLLRQYQLQIWPSDRPGLLVWIVIDDPVRGKRFVSDETMPNTVAALQELMDDRGAPLVLPLLDLQDRQAVSEDDAWNFNQVRLADASKRYNTQAWLALRLYQSATGHWRGARMLNLNGDGNLTSLVASNVSELMGKVVPEAIDSLASQYSYVANAVDEELFIQIENINDYQAFSQATTYIASLEVVHRLTVDYVDADRLGLRLFVEGEVPLLLDTLRRDKRMAELVNTSIPASETSSPEHGTSSPELEISSPELESVAPSVATSTSSIISRHRFRWGGQ